MSSVQNDSNAPYSHIMSKNPCVGHHFVCHFCSLLTNKRYDRQVQWLHSRQNHSNEWRANNIFIARYDYRSRKWPLLIDCIILTWIYFQNRIARNIHLNGSVVKNVLTVFGYVFAIVSQKSCWGTHLKVWTYGQPKGIHGGRYYVYWSSSNCSILLKGSFSLNSKKADFPTANNSFLLGSKSIVRVLAHR